MTTIGIIGSGMIGGTVARLAVDAGYDVVVANSRGPETLGDLVDELGPKARAATAQQAAEAADLAVVSVPLKAISQLPAAALAGKVVLDTCNYYPDRDGSIEALDAERTTTSRLVQQQLPDSHVVKAFNNIYFKHLATMGRPAGSDDRNTLLIAGDDEASKRQATEFIESLGYDVLDTGTLDDSWRFERDRPAYAGAYSDGGFDHPRPASASRLTELLGQAQR